MEDLNEAEELYMMVFAGGMYFFIPLEQMNRVVSMEDTAGLQVWDFRKLTEPDYSHPQKREALIVRGGEEEEFGLIIDKAVGMCRVRSQEKIPLDPLVCCRENSYLDGVVYREEMDPPLVYLVDTHRLSCLLQECIE